MALKPFQQGIMIPDGLPITTTVPSFTVDATGEGVATIFTSPINGTINALAFRLNAVTTGDNISVEVQSVLTASALPSDTQWAAGTGQSFSLTTAMSQSWQTVALSVGAAVSVGDVVALVVKRNDVAGAGNFTILGAVTEGAQPRNAASKALAWAGSTTVPTIYPIYSETAAVALLDHCIPYVVGTHVLSAAAAVDEVANIINVPFAARVTGFWLQLRTTTADAVAVVRLYNSTGSAVMATSKFDVSQYLMAPTTQGRFKMPFLSATALTINTNYRIALYISAGATEITSWSLNGATAMNSLHMGSLCFASSRVNSGVWSNNTSLRYTIGVVVDQLDDSAASGGAAGGLAHIIGGGL